MGYYIRKGLRRGQALPGVDARCRTIIVLFDVRNERRDKTVAAESIADCRSYGFKFDIHR